MQTFRLVTPDHPLVTALLDAGIALDLRASDDGLVASTRAVVDWKWRYRVPRQTASFGAVFEPSSFGEDADGELYIVNLGGSIYRISD